MRIPKKLPQLCVLESLILSEYPTTSADSGGEYQGSSNNFRVRVEDYARTPKQERKQKDQEVIARLITFPYSHR